MFYWLYQQFGGGEYVPVFNLLSYITFRTGMALFTAQIVVMLMGSRFIRWMQA
jgi:phospho-N-acetylmuramoyl-pentapeptide-transferase